jgi:hypothetical protein
MEGQANIDDISSPIIYNVSFCKLLSYSWLELLTYFKEVTYSEYNSKRIVDAMSNNGENVTRLN